MTKTERVEGGDQRSSLEDSSGPQRQQQANQGTPAASGSSRDSRVGESPPPKDVKPGQSQKPPPESSELRTESQSSLDSSLKEIPDADRKMPPSDAAGLRDDDSEESSPASAQHETSNNVSEMLLLGLEQIMTHDLPVFVRQNDSALTFPEKLVLMLAYVERTTAKGANHRLANESSLPSIGWTRDGTGIVVRDKEHLTNTWLPRFFVGQGKFSSFVRKLYRWGFQKTNPGSDSEPSNYGSSKASGGNKVVLFANENFQRDRLGLLGNMQSVTAPKIRSSESAALTDNSRRSKGKSRRKKRSTPSIKSPTTETRRLLQQIRGEGSFAASGFASAIPPSPPQLDQLTASQQPSTLGATASAASVAAQNALLQSVVGSGLLHQMAPPPPAPAGPSLSFLFQEVRPSFPTSGSAAMGHNNLHPVIGAGLPYYPSASLSDRLLAEQSLTNALAQARRQSLGLATTSYLDQQVLIQQEQEREERERQVALANLLWNENRQRLLLSRRQQEEEEEDQKRRHRGER